MRTERQSEFEASILGQIASRERGRHRFHCVVLKYAISSNASIAGIGNHRAVQKPI